MSDAVDKIFAELDLDRRANLGLATTANLLAELQARFEVSGNALCATGMKKTRDWCTTEELEYRSVEDDTPSDLDIDPEIVEVYIYIFEGQEPFISAQEPDELLLHAIEDDALVLLKLDDDGTLGRVSENGTVTPLALGIARQIKGFDFILIDPEGDNEDS